MQPSQTTVPMVRVRAPASPAQLPWGRLGGGRRGPLRRSTRSAESDGFGESVCLLTGFQCLDTMPATEMPTSAAEWALLATSTPMLAGPIMIQTGATSAAGRLRRALPAVIAFFAIALGYAEAAPEPTFNREVVRILQQHCQECHRAGG